MKEFAPHHTEAKSAGWYSGKRCCYQCGQGQIQGNVGQGSATTGTHAKRGRPEGFAWHAKRFHAQANCKLLRFNKFTFESMSKFQCSGFKSHSIIEIVLSR